MFEFLKTHPSLFIIGATVIIIILIFLFFTKKQNQEYKIEQIAGRTNENEYIELQQSINTTQSSPDEVDSIAPTTPPLPGPKLSRKLRYDTGNQPRKLPHIYDTPRVQQFATIPESVGDESSSSFSYVPAEIHRQQTNMAGTSTSGNDVVVFREPHNKNEENRISVSDVHKHSYVSFDGDGEFDSFDEFRKSCADTLRLTVDFEANNMNYIVPVADKI